MAFVCVFWLWVVGEDLSVSLKEFPILIRLLVSLFDGIFFKTNDVPTPKEHKAARTRQVLCCNQTQTLPFWTCTFSSRAERVACSYPGHCIAATKPTIDFSDLGKTAPAGERWSGGG